MDRETRRIPIRLSLDREVVADARALAARERRSLSSLVEWLLVSARRVAGEAGEVPGVPKEVSDAR